MLSKLELSLNVTLYPCQRLTEISICTQTDTRTHGCMDRQDAFSVPPKAFILQHIMMISVSDKLENMVEKGKMRC